MKTAFVILALAAVATAPAQSPPATLPAAAMPLVREFLGYGDLVRKQNPPVMPHCKLDPTPFDERTYMAFDLNDDGVPEYFVEDIAGAHDVFFALTNAHGKLLTTPKHIRDIGGDRIVVLTKTHNHYHDIVCSYSDLGGVDSDRWEFNGKRYVLISTIHFNSDRHFIESNPASVAAAWYCDPQSFPTPAKKRLHWQGP